METRVMGTVGVRRSSVGAGAAFSTRLRQAGAMSLSEPYGGLVAMNSEVPERGQAHDPDREHMRSSLFRHCSERVRLRYHTQVGTKGEAVGYVTAQNKLFLALPSMPPIGTSFILEGAEQDGGQERQTMTGTVEVICPGSDEFGFPAGVGLSVTEGLQVLHRFMMPGGSIQETD